jgi:ribosomal protein S18 acetylase RimI-like enzyme
MDKYNQFTNKIILIEYDSSKTEIAEALLKDNVAKKICRDLIHISCIEDILKSEEINGYIAKVDDEYVGFVFFKHNYDTFYLSLIATKPKLGMPLGQILLTKMEEEGRKRKAYTLQANSIPEAIKFYEKMGFEVKYLDEECGEYFIEKKL